MYMQSQGSLREPQTVYRYKRGVVVHYRIIRCGFKDAKWVGEWTRRRIRRGSPSVFSDPNVPILNRRLNLDMNLSEWDSLFLEMCFDVWFCKEHMEMER